MLISDWSSDVCSSDLAKVARDREMQRLDADHPGYGFAQHKGYGTPEHLDALRRLGPSAIHRMSFAPCKQRDMFVAVPALDASPASGALSGVAVSSICGSWEEGSVGDEGCERLDYRG